MIFRFFKTVKELAEFPDLEHRLQVIIFALAGFMKMKHDRDIVITETLRPNDKTSVHAYGRGCDVRCNDWSNEEVEDAKLFLATINYPGKSATLLVHGKGRNIHLHIQTSWRAKGISFVASAVELFKTSLKED